MKPNSIRIPCLEITQPIGSFYIGTINHADLVQISYTDIRRLADREVEEYLGIERPLSENRVKEITRYVNDNIDATFPTGVILAIASDYAEYDPQKKEMQIKSEKDVAKIIDGQHRIAGLEEYKGKKFEMNVVIFVDMDIEDQAMVFATINLAQTKVSKSLVYDLYEHTKRPSPQKTAHNIARLLNIRENSPFKGRIKILGTANPMVKATQILTQATFVESLLILISGSLEGAEIDRDLLKKYSDRKRIPDLSGNAKKRAIFRYLYKQEQDAEIAKIILNYFQAIERRWSTAWNKTGRGGSVLPRTNGFRALMRFLPEVSKVVGFPDTVPSTEDFIRLFGKINLADSEFDIDNFRPGSSGEREFLNLLQSHLSQIN